MAMDGLNLYASTLEIKKLCGGKIDKIQQPERDEIIITVRADGGTKRILLSASAAQSRAQLTETKKANPIDAPMFCMLLRKKLIGGRIISVEQENFDRVLTLGVETRNELGDVVALKIAAELMGKNSNIILVNENGIVADAIRHVSAAMSNVRLILPGVRYELPPRQDKLNPLDAQINDFYDVLSRDGRIDKNLSSTYFGLSPNMAGELCLCITHKRMSEELDESEKRAVAAWLYEFYSKLNDGVVEPTLALNEYDEPTAVFPFVPADRNVRRMVTMSEAFDRYYEQHEIAERMQRRGAAARRILQNNIERCEKKLSLYTEAIASEEAINELRLYGELLTANLHVLKGMSDTANVLNYYIDPPEMTAIPLDLRYSARDNAQRYYKKYQKAKAGREMALKQKSQTEEEIAYLIGQMDNLGKCTTDDDMSELIEELRDEGYAKSEKGQKKKQKQKHMPSQPMCFTSSDGIMIYVGKNNRQNDMLTIKMADADDIWLHTKAIPGSHVIIKCGASEPPKQTLFEAANLAAYYSSARGGENIPVDYTKRRNVKKPSGSKPGMVIYTTNKTAYITPEESVIKSMKKE